MLKVENLSPCKKKLFIAVCGLVDSGKSTFIKTATELLSGFKTPLDALCDEHEKGITIRQASIFCPYKGFDIVFLDCPGHKEFQSEIRSGLSKSNYIIEIIDGERKEESVEYLNWLKTIKDFNPKKIHVLVSKSNEGLMSYDSINYPEEFKALVSWVLDDIIKDVNEDDLVDPVQTALRVINDAFHMLPKIENPTVMFSYGKDSVTLMKLLEISKWIYKIKPLFLESPLDMEEIDDELKENVKKYFNIEVYPFKGVPDGWNFENHSIPEIMKAKAEAIKKVIKENDSQLTFVGSRHFEGDGTRAKDKFFSPRDKDGNANFYETSYEKHGSEYTSVSGVNYSNCRVSPLLDFTEADIWRFINYYKIPVCKGYFSKNGKRYRSLGDKDTTVPIDSQASTIEDIITEIEKSTDTERICRVTQDNSEKYGMEKIRTIGFF